MASIAVHAAAIAIAVKREPPPRHRPGPEAHRGEAGAAGREEARADACRSKVTPPAPEPAPAAPAPPVAQPARRLPRLPGANGNAHPRARAAAEGGARAPRAGHEPGRRRRRRGRPGALEKQVAAQSRAGATRTATPRVTRDEATEGDRYLALVVQRALHVELPASHHHPGPGAALPEAAWSSSGSTPMVTSASARFEKPLRQRRPSTTRWSGPSARPTRPRRPSSASAIAPGVSA